jgi:hypothetical protein
MHAGTGILYSVLPLYQRGNDESQNISIHRWDEGQVSLEI